MSVLKRNIFANFGGQAATTLVALITVPLYIRYLGTSGYGLVSFLLALQAVTAVLDFGLSTTANREVSRYLAQERPAADRHDLVRTLELFYYAIGLAIFVALAAATPWLATHWIGTEEFDAHTLRLCLGIAAASIALRWPTALYQGVLRGSEQQVTLNVLNSVAAMVRGFGTILVLIFIARTVLAFYWWQLGFAAVELALFAVAVGRGASGFSGRSGRFVLPLLRDLWRFSMRVGGLSMFALVLKQLDKLVISSLLPIRFVGFYNAASLASNGIGKIAQPVQQAVFPRLTQLHERSSAPQLASTFHRAVQLTALLSVPAACVLLFFPRDVLWLWTRNAELAAAGAGALSVLAGAMLLNSMMSVPFSLQLASGLTWLPLLTNGVGAVVLAPLTWFLVKGYGITGGAVAWLVFNAVYFFVVPPIMFRHVLPGQLLTWFTRDTLPFALAGLACFGTARLATAPLSLSLKAAGCLAALAAYGLLTLGAHRDLRAAAFALLPVRAQARRGATT